MILTPCYGLRHLAAPPCMVPSNIQTLHIAAHLQIAEDGFVEVANTVLAAHESGELAEALASGHDGYKIWVKGVGKAQKRKGKRLFMPMRIAFTVS